jgi:hypothetical protein
MGQTVMSVQIDAGSSEDLSGLTPGYYILTGGIPSDKKAVFKMFIP